MIHPDADNFILGCMKIGALLLLAFLGPPKMVIIPPHTPDDGEKTTPPKAGFSSFLLLKFKGFIVYVTK